MLTAEPATPSAPPAVNGGGASADQPDRVTVAGAARRLNVNHSTVSRQIEKLGVPRDAEGKFSYALYLEKRGGLNPLMARNRGAGMGYEDAPGFAGGPPAPPATAANGVRTEPSPLGRAHTAEKALRAQLLQLELEERRGNLCPVAEVDAAARDAAAAIQQALDERNRQLAEQLAALSDVRAIEIVLAEADRAMLEKVAMQFAPRAKTVEATADVA